MAGNSYNNKTVKNIIYNTKQFWSQTLIKEKNRKGCRGFNLPVLHFFNAQC